MTEIEENWQLAKFYCSVIKLIYSTKNATAPPPVPPPKGCALGPGLDPAGALKPPAAWPVADATSLFSPFRLCLIGGLIKPH